MQSRMPRLAALVLLPGRHAAASRSIADVSGILVWGVVKSNRCQVIAYPCPCSTEADISPSRPQDGVGAGAERPSRVAAGHRVATQPLTAASPAAGLRSGRGDVVGG